MTIKENIPEDFLKAAKLPYDKDRLTYEITLPAKSVKSHIFARKPFETTLEIEDAAPPEAKRERVYRSSYGKSGVSVRLTEETKISAEITVPESGKYSFCVMGRSLGGSAKLKIDGKEAATVCAETSADLRYPICAKADMKKGKHRLEITADGAVLTDKIIITSDPNSAGFMYPFEAVIPYEIPENLTKDS